MDILNNYPGSKGGDGVYQNIINHIPPHDEYYELFLGSGQIFNKKRPAHIGSFLSDIDTAVIAAWYEKNQEVTELIELSDKGWRWWLYQAWSAKKKVSRFFYLDPPYPMSSRSTQRNLYKHEMSDNDHKELLRRLIDIDYMTKQEATPFNIMISTYPNELYEHNLSGWYKHEFTAQTRGGIATEVIYMNYNIKETGLHEYTFYGSDYRKRELIKDRQNTIIRKLKKLQKNDPLEFHAALHRIETEFNLQIQES